MIKFSTPLLVNRKKVTLSSYFKCLFFLIFVLPIYSVFAQQAPNITYTPNSYNFTKGVSVSGFSNPTNTGSAVPVTVRGDIVESIGIGTYDADKIAKTGDGHLISLLVDKGVVEKTNTITKASMLKFINRDKPWGVVKDSRGNTYWTETGYYSIVTNPNQMDETSWVGYGLDIAGAFGLPGKAGSAVNGINNIREIYSAVTGGDDLLRTISGQSEPPPYILKFTGRILKLAPGETTPQVFVSGIQMPTGLAIDKDDNLYVSCFTAKFKVEGGVSFSGGSVGVIPDYSNTYNSKIVKITTTSDKTQTDIGAWSGIDYPTALGIDDNYNLFTMFYTDDFTKVKVAKIQKYPTGQTSGNTYQTANIVINNSTLYQDIAVDKPGNLYISDFYTDKIYMLPFSTTTANNLSVFSDKVVAPKALYVDVTTNQLWVKDGKFVNTGGVKKLNLYGYNITPILPEGLSLSSDGRVSGTPKEISSSKTYTISASNIYGLSSTTVTIAVNQIAAPSISYATSTFSFPVNTVISTIPAPTNTGGAFNQQIGPVKMTKVFTGGTTNQQFAFDGSGNVYFTQPDSGRVMKINSLGQSSALISGLTYPYGVVVDRKNGYLYYSDRKANKVMLVYPGFTTGIDLLTMGTPAGMAIDNNGFLYILNQGSGSIVKYDPKTNTLVDNFVTNLYQPTDISIYNNTLYVGSAIDGKIRTIPINSPTTINVLTTVQYSYGMTMDDFGNIYLGCFGGVKKIPTGTSTAQIYSLPSGFNYVIGVGTDLANNLYISAGEYEKQSIYKVVPDGYTISPALPAGLVLNANGTITGTPTTITSATNYTVKATNIKGESSAVLNIAVINVPTTNIQYTTPNTFYRTKTITPLNPVITGGNPTSYSISPALPSGLSFGTSDGRISGTPAANQSATNYTITANNSSGSKSTTISITITEQPPSGLSYTFATNALLRDKPLGNVNPTISGGTGLTYSVSPALPAGLTLNTSTGVISGTPTTITASQNYTVTATNNGGSTSATFALSVKLDPPSNLSYTFASNSLLRDEAISTITPTYQGSGATSFSINPALPTGLSFNITTGAISGTPTAISPSTSYTVTVNNDVGSSNTSFNLAVRVDPPVNFKYNLTHTELLRNGSFPSASPTYSGSPVTSFTISPSLPTGLSINSSTGTISGTPTVLSSNTNYTVTATNDGGSATFSFQLLVTELAPTSLQYSFISSSLLRNVQVSPIYPSYQGSTATSFVISPALPSGLSLNTSTGVISGTPTVISANTTYTVTASNTGGSTTTTFSLLVRVDPPTNLRYSFRDNELQKDVNMPEALPKYSGSPVSTFTITPSLPSGLSFDTSTGKISGIPTSLNATTSYTVTATNDGGTGTTTFSLAVVRIPIPDISYSPSTFTFTKGTPITPIATPSNTGTVFPQQKIGETLYSGLTSPSGVATDLSGNTYVAYFEGGNTKIKVLTKGATQLSDFITSGLGTTPAYDLATDVAGNIYMSVGATIKKITPSKVVSDFVTNLSNAKGLFIDGDNDLYVADHGAGKVIKYTDCNSAAKSELITGLNLPSTYYVPAENPNDIVVDRQKNIYVLQSSSLLSSSTYFMFLYRYLAADGYVKTTRERPITSVDYSLYMTVDNRDNIYINTDRNSILVLKTYVDGGKRIAPSSTSSKVRGLSLDSDQNAFYALLDASDGLGKAEQFGYSTAGLPAGLQLNANGTITGTPTNLQGQTIHKVSANSFYGTSTDTLYISVVDTVPQFSYATPNLVLTKGVTNLSMLPIKAGGPVNSYSISPTTLPNGISFNTSTGRFSGTATQLQNIASSYTVTGTNTGGTYSTVVTFRVVDVAPTALTYASTNLVLTINRPYTGVAPTSSGGPVLKYSITPDLPMGFKLDSLTGIISGRPTAVLAATNYTLKAENTGGNSTQVVTITVNDVPPSISYIPTNEFSFKRGQSITSIPAPTNTGGPILNYSTSGLPAGLSLNSDGSISGTPTQLSARTLYHVTANGGVWGQNTADLYIEVYSLLPDSFKYSTPVTLVKGTPMQSLSPQRTTNIGDAVQKYSVSPDLPAGLTLNTTTGVISGTPTELQIAPGQLYYVYAENGAGKIPATVAFILKDAPPTISYNTENVFTKGHVISIPVSSTGGAVTKYTISPALPTGMAIDSLTGNISGTPNVLSVRTQYTITGTNYGNPSSTKNIFVTVNDEAPIISYNTTNNFIRTQAITSLSPSSTGGAVVQYSISPALPAGLSLNTTTGVISGTPTVSAAAANYIITAQNTGGSTTATISISVKNAAPVISYNSSNTFTKGVAITDLQPVSTGGNQITFSISPAVPAGLSFNTSTGVISGTPTAITTQANYTITATNDGGTQNATFSITVNDKPPGDISYTSNNQFYVGYAITSLTPTVATGGGVILSYAITPSLPAGLSFNTTNGVISGTPTAVSSQTTYTVTASNSGGNKQITFTITVVRLDATITKTDVNCNGGSDGSATANVTGGQAPFQYSWSPSGGTTATASGLTAGTYTVTITDANNSTITRSITIGQPTALVATISSTVISQKNGSDGTATVNVSGGTAPYTYSWSPSGGSAATANGLTEGTYTVTIQDAHLCSITKTVFVDAPPATPTGLTATSGNTQNSLTWTANPENDVVSYKIYGGTNSNPTTLIQTISVPTVSYTHTGLTNGTTYYYKITAIDGGGNESVATTVTSSTPKTPQTITFNALTTKTYGDADYDAGATASSGLTISYSSNNPAVATIVAGKIHIVGNGSAIITANQAGNGLYFPATSQSQTLTVLKKTLTVSLTGTVSKTYDGNVAASLLPANYVVSGIVGSDNVILNNPSSGTYDNKNKGTAKLVTVTGLTISGSNVADYQLSSTTVNAAIGVINSRALTVTASANNKVYDGNSLATITLSDNRVSGDVLNTSHSSATFSDKNVANGKTVGINGISIAGTDAANYSFNTATTTTANITAKTLQVSAVASNKVYDGNNIATVVLSDDRVSGDILSIAYTSRFDNKNIGLNKVVSVTGIGISGTDAGNYVQNTSTSTTANVTAKALTITAVSSNKIYDGNTVASTILNDDRVSGDILTASYTSATFSDKNVGNGKTVSVSGINIAGTDANNYTYNNATTTTASITTKALTITADDKQKYEGEVNPTLTVSYSGFIVGENNTVLSTQPNINTVANTSTLRGQYPIIASGASSPNYAISYLDGVLTIKAEAPTSVSLAPVTLYENRPAGTLAGNLSSTSLSPFATFTYSLVTGTGDTDNSSFMIVGNELQTAASLNYEAKQQYKVRIRSTTQYGLYLEQTFTVNLSDVNESPTLDAIAEQRIYLQEGVTEYISLSNVTVGPDFNQTLQTTVQTDNPGLFQSLNVNNREISYIVNSGKTGTANITVTVKDNGGTANGGVDQISRTFTLIIDATPVITGTGTETGTKFETAYSGSPQIGKGLSSKLKLEAEDIKNISWNGSGLSSYSINNPVATPSVTTTYEATVTNSKGFSTKVSIEVFVREDYFVDADNNISPNGDGINDNWKVKNIETYPEHELIIFDQAGKTLYKVRNYKNEWNGTLNGLPLDEGTYYYIFKFDDPKINTVQGFITIVK